MFFTIFLQNALCDFQWLFWHSREQYHARPHDAQADSFLPSAFSVF